MSRDRGETTRLWAAIADPTRLRIIDILLVAGDATATDLAAELPISRQGVAKHLGVLEDCGLVRSRKVGRVRTYRLVPRRLEIAERWMAARRRTWETRLDQLDRYLETMEENDQ